jgi:hypothetical protein
VAAAAAKKKNEPTLFFPYFSLIVYHFHGKSRISMALENCPRAAPKKVSQMLRRKEETRIYHWYHETKTFPPVAHRN